MNYQGGMQQSGSGEGWLASIRNRGKRHYSTSAYLLPFLFVRALQMAVLIVIVGLTSNWIATFGNSGLRIPENIIILLGFAAAGILQNGIAIFVAFIANHIVLAAVGLLDIMFIIFFSVFAAKFAPVEFVKCNTIGNQTAADQQTYADSFANDLNSTKHQGANFTTTLGLWVRSSAEQCMELRGTWGICIALPILFFISLLLTLGLVYMARTVEKSSKGGDPHYRR